MNNHILNTSFFAEEPDAMRMLIWIRNYYIPALEANGGFSDILLCEIASPEEPGVVKYALQARCCSLHQIDNWTEGKGGELLAKLTSATGGKVLSFNSILNIIGK